MLQHLKLYLKKYFQIIWLRNKFSPGVQISQRHLFNFYQINKNKTGEIKLRDTGYKVFSQFEEDGKLIYILAMIGIKHSSFIEIGSDDGINSNCANLALNFGWYGLFLDGNKKSISRGRYFYNKYPTRFGYKPTFIHSFVTRENINDTIEKAGFNGEIDLLSIDIDGNDYWIWDAIVVVQPRIVIIETHVIYGYEDIVVPYNPEYTYPGISSQYHGASPKAMVKLGQKKGYRLIGANDLGFNFIFLRNDEGQDIFPEVSIEQILQHPNCAKDIIDPYKLNLPFERPIE